MHPFRQPSGGMLPFQARAEPQPSFSKLRLVKRALPEAGADGEHAPVVAARHVWQLAQSLDDGVVVHDDHSFLVANLGHVLADERRQLEVLGLPVAGQVLSAALDGAVLVNGAGAADADDGCERQRVFSAQAESSFNISTTVMTASSRLISSSA